MAKPTDIFTSMTAEKARHLFDYDQNTGALFWSNRIARNGRFKNGVRAGTIRHGEYRVIVIGGRDFMEHRLIWLIVTGEWPADEIDHIDGNKLNNAWSNLRPATRQQNEWNKRFSGVCLHKQSGRWQARITENGRPKFKMFGSRDEAIAWRVENEARIKGAFSPENVSEASR